MCETNTEYEAAFLRSSKYENARRKLYPLLVFRIIFSILLSILVAIKVIDFYYFTLKEIYIYRRKIIILIDFPMEHI